MKTIEQEYLIRAPVAKVWQAFVNAEVIQGWGGGPDVVMDEFENTEFRLWGGDIYGKNLKVIVNKLLVQEWFADDFREPSVVTFDFASQGDKTVVKLVHKNVPDDREHDIAEGWCEYYLGPLRDSLETKYR